MPLLKSPLIFPRPYRDGERLTSDSLDQIAIWTSKVSSELTALLHGSSLGCWGIIRAESLPNSDESVRLIGQNIEWAEMLLLMPTGKLLVLPAGSGDDSVVPVEEGDNLSVRAKPVAGVNGSRFITKVDGAGGRIQHTWSAVRRS
jgi:hypothetical protein